MPFSHERLIQTPWIRFIRERLNEIDNGDRILHKTSIREQYHWLFKFDSFTNDFFEHFECDSLANDFTINHRPTKAEFKIRFIRK